MGACPSHHGGQLVRERQRWIGVVYQNRTATFLDTLGSASNPRICWSTNTKRMENIAR